MSFQPVTLEPLHCSRHETYDSDRKCEVSQKVRQITARVLGYALLNSD
jgi:hypothetical protein